MKRILIIVLGLFPFLCGAQTLSNFTITETGDLIWQKVFDYDCGQEELCRAFETDQNFVDFRGSDLGFSCSMKPQIFDPTEFGKPRGSVPMYMVIYTIGADITVQIKEGRYRVTASALRLYKNNDSDVFSGAGMEKIELFAVKKDQYTTSFRREAAGLYDAFLTKLLTPRRFDLDTNW